VLAVSAYREFLTLYPSHPRSDYAQFRAGESYFKQKNSSDRDQTATKQALEEYERLLDIYPQSTHVEETRSRIHTCRQTLARAHHQVGFFYQKTRKSWRSAIARYETILTDYPDYEKLDEVLFRISQCLSFAGRYAEARPYLQRLRSSSRRARSFPRRTSSSRLSPPPPPPPRPRRPLQQLPRPHLPPTNRLPHRRLQTPDLKCHFEDVTKTS
jgi:outer membrane assembly lipoprotein YfiO